jgi:aryl-alcohol dehydrogenase-like predicted oxidoreductase
MEYITLGKSGLSVSRLCYGTLTIGPLQAGLSVKDGAALLEYAAIKGINFFDTAELYKTEPYIRLAMKRSGRYDVIISTKTYAYSRADAEKAVENARTSLDRDYIDLFMLHEQENEHTLRGHNAALKYLLECKANGIIKAVGLSTHHVEGVRAATQYGLDVVHPLINITGFGIADGTRLEMEEAISAAHTAGLGVFAMKVLAGGNLFSRADECLSYAMSLPAVHSVAVGMQSIEEIDANVRFFETGTFSSQDIERLSGQSRRLMIESWCNGCGKCVGRCGLGAIGISNGKAEVDAAKCVLCAYCGAVCNNMCIKIV